MLKDEKFLYKTSVRINDYIKHIIEKTLREARIETGLKISNGQIKRAFWLAMAEDPKFHKQCMKVICETIAKDASDKTKGRYYERRKKY